MIYKTLNVKLNELGDEEFNQILYVLKLLSYNWPRKDQRNKNIQIQDSLRNRSRIWS
jgi:hypothetical protein